MAEEPLSRAQKVLQNAKAKPADEIIISDSSGLKRLDEGKWFKGQFDNEIRVDRATHLQSGDKHAHIYDRNGNELRALTQDGKPSHNTKPFKLTKTQYDVLKGQGFNLPASRIVETVLVAKGRFRLLD